MEGINVLTWPANSPDLSPIENVWAIIKERLSLRHFRSFDAYKKGLVEEWDNLEQSIIQNLYNSMENRLNQVLDNHGGPTKY